MTSKQQHSHSHSRTLEATWERSQLHPRQHLRRHCSNNLQTTCNKHWVRDLETTLHPVLDANRYTEHQVPYKASQATIRGSLRSHATRGTTTQNCRTMSKSPYCSTKKGTSDTTTTSRINHHVRADQVTDLGIPQSSNSMCAAPYNDTSNSKQRTMTSANGERAANRSKES